MIYLNLKSAFKRFINFKLYFSEPIKFDDKFYMVSENYNFDLGTTTDLQGVVNTFLKLSNQSESRLIDDYKTSIG